MRHFFGIRYKASFTQCSEYGFKVLHVQPPGGAVDYNVIQVGPGIFGVGSEYTVH